MSGGTTLFPDIVDRLYKELTSLALTISKIKAIATPKRKYLTWIGGSTLVSVSSFEQR